MPFRISIRRMVRITHGMLHDAIQAVVERDPELAEDVISRDGEVDRLNWLVARQYNMLIRDMKLAEKMEVTRETAINYLLISRILERMADHAVRIAENGLLIEKHKLSKEWMRDIQKVGDESIHIMDIAMEALYKSDSNMANQTISESKNFAKKCDALYDKLSLKEETLALPLGYVVESIRRIGYYSRDISECVINYVVEITG